MKVQLIFLGHSGFALIEGKQALIFDYYTDTQGIVNKLAQEGYDLTFFVSHGHGDHYNPEIFSYANSYYIIENSVHYKKGAADAHILESQIFTIAPGESKHCGAKNWDIRCFPSTDEGGAFWIDTGLGQYYHSGDLNWWHWLGDTPENKRYADELKEQCFASLTGLSCDLAMFPVDARLEGAREWGIIDFLKLVTVRGPVVSMHHNGPAWQPSDKIKALYPKQQYWIPEQAGDSLALTVPVQPQ